MALKVLSLAMIPQSLQDKRRKAKQKRTRMMRKKKKKKKSKGPISASNKGRTWGTMRDLSERNHGNSSHGHGNQ